MEKLAEYKARFVRFYYLSDRLSGTGEKVDSVINSFNRIDSIIEDYFTCYSIKSANNDL